MAGPSSPEYGGAGILMTAPMTATERDLRALAGMVSDYRADLPAHGLPMSLLSDLASQIRCDAVLFEGLDSKRQGTWFAESFPADDDAPDDGLTQAHWQHYWDCRPCSHPDRTGDVRSVIKIADFYSAREWHSTGMYCDLYQPQGIEHELMLTLAAGSACPKAPSARTWKISTVGSKSRAAPPRSPAPSTTLPHRQQRPRTAGWPQLTAKI
jgi:hypothetical protein